MAKDVQISETVQMRLWKIMVDDCDFSNYYLVIADSKSKAIIKMLDSVGQQRPEVAHIICVPYRGEKIPDENRIE